MMFTKILLGFAISASVRASRGNGSVSALNTLYTPFVNGNGTQPTAFHAPGGFGEGHVLWLSSSEKFSSTVLMLNDNTICGASVEDYFSRLKEDEQQAVNIRNNFNVNVMMVYYRGYVMYMQKK